MALQGVGVGEVKKDEEERNNSFQNSLGKADLALHPKQGGEWN